MCAVLPIDLDVMRDGRTRGRLRALRVQGGWRAGRKRA
jgi:hypothetical protein